MFPVFRAHPLLFQTLLSVVLRLHDTDWTARAFAAAIGVATVAADVPARPPALRHRRRADRRAAARGHALPRRREQAGPARRPDDPVRDRRALLRGHATWRTGRLSWLLAGGSMMGAAVLSKETSIVLLGGLYVFFALTPSARHAGPAPAPDPRAAGRGDSGLAADAPAVRAFQDRPELPALAAVPPRRTTPTFFYFTVLPGLDRPGRAAGRPGRSHLAAPGGHLAGAPAAAWLIVPVLFFTLWPVKGFQYLLPAARRSPSWLGAPWPARSRDPRGSICGDGTGWPGRAGCPVRRARCARDGAAGRGHGGQPGHPGVGRGSSRPPAAPSWPEAAG